MSTFLASLGAAVAALYGCSAAAAFSSRLGRRSRLMAGTVFGTLSFAPVAAPASIALVPFPFGIMIVASVLHGFPDELVGALALAPRWNFVAFVATGFVSWRVARRVIANPAVQRTASPPAEL